MVLSTLKGGFARGIEYSERGFSRGIEYSERGICTWY